MRIAGSMSKARIQQIAEKHGQSIARFLPMGKEIFVTFNTNSKVDDLIADLDDNGILIEYPKEKNKKNS